jgi:hypothetical protein
MELDRWEWDSLMSKLEMLEAAYKERYQDESEMPDLEYRLMIVIKKLCGLIKIKQPA